MTILLYSFFRYFNSPAGAVHMSRFQWQSVKTKYREQRPSIHGEELRWIVNSETIVDTASGHVTTRGVIRHPGICVIAPFVDADRIALMRQYRYSIDRELWELPAGTLNGREENSRMVAIETPAECAARELEEETGYRAGRLEKVAECYAMPGSNDELIHVFFAYDLTASNRSPDIGEVILEVRGVSLPELERMVAAGEIRDAKTLVALFYALSRPPRGLQID
jgi:ADP-ribose pyrophosphatase